MFRHIPSVYSMEPPPKPTSGQRSGPSRLSKSTMRAPGEKTTLVIRAVSAQLPRSGGLSQILAWLIWNGWNRNETGAENAVVIPLDASLAWTRQKYVAATEAVVVICADVWPGCSAAVVE